MIGLPELFQMLLLKIDMKVKVYHFLVWFKGLCSQKDYSNYLLVTENIRVKIIS